MNDLPKGTENGYLTMYADDTESSTVVNICDDITEKVIPDLMKICDRFKTNKRTLNGQLDNGQVGYLWKDKKP